MCVRHPFAHIVLVVSNTKILWLSLWGKAERLRVHEGIRQNVVQLRPVQPNQFETNKLKVTNVQIIACTLSALMRDIVHIYIYTQYIYMYTDTYMYLKICVCIIYVYMMYFMLSLRVRHWDKRMQRQ